MPGFLYAQDRNDSIYVNLYVSSDTSFRVAGKDVALSMNSEMPWGGKSKITLALKEKAKAALKLRVPGWARNRVAPGGLYSYLEKVNRRISLAINGQSTPTAIDASGYISLDRTWNDGDVVEIEFPFEVRKVIANAEVKEDRRRMAVERGPLVYCAEWPDVPGGRALQLLFDSGGEFKPSFNRDFYDGVTVIDTHAGQITNPQSAPQPVRLIPYYLWSNRGAGEMSVWLSTAGYSVGDPGPAGGYIFYENPNYASDGWRYLEAAPFDQSGGAKWGCFRSTTAGGRGKAVGTGAQNTADMLAACSEPGTAAYLCANLSVNGVRGWYLPSTDELDLMYRNLKAAGLGDFRDGGVTDNLSYWASTQSSVDMADHIDFADFGRHHSDDKDFPRRVRAIRKI
jgi:hypothetical protein